MGFVKKMTIGGLLAACVAGPLLAPSPAQAWWARPGWGWGWHGGWGWRGGVFIGGPAFVAAPPVVVAPPVAYAPAPYRFIPGHYDPWGRWVPPHWGYY